MNFERGTDIKNQIGVGISDRILDAHYCLFYIKGFDPSREEKYSLYTIKIEMKGDIVESSKKMLSYLTINPLPWKKIREVAFIPSKRRKREFKKYVKEGIIPSLHIEAGTFYGQQMNRFCTQKPEYIRYQGQKIYHLGQSPHFISMPIRESSWEHLLNIFRTSK